MRVTIRPAVGLLALVIVLAACSVRTTARRSTPAAAVTTSTNPDTEALMRADRGFAADVARDGIDAWVKWFANDGQQIGPGRQVVGHGAIRDYMASTFSDPAAKLAWWPVSARISSGGDLGYTIGRYEARTMNPDGSVTVRGTGRYITIWRKQADGDWKVELDTGHPDPAPKQP
jgi:ketosteroid isomerase-like protein